MFGCELDLGAFRLSVQDSKPPTSKAHKSISPIQSAFFTICGTKPWLFDSHWREYGDDFWCGARLKPRTWRVEPAGLLLYFLFGARSLLDLRKDSKRAQSVETNRESSDAPLQSCRIALESSPARKCFTQGLFLSLSNPKDILFFIAFFPQFMGVADSMLASIALLVGLWIVLDFSLLLTLGTLAQRIGNPRHKKTISIISDVVLMMIGICGAVYGAMALLQGS